MRIPDEVRKCIVYLGIEIPTDGKRRFHWGGTGFLVNVHFERIPGASCLFLVSAKHVADHLIGREFVVRINRKDGRGQPLKVIKDSVKWFFHPDQSVDLALFPLSLDHLIFDCLPIPTTMILTEGMRRQKGIGVGDEVFITGLFVYHAGSEKNIPIIRVGNIAMTPEERIPIKDFGEMEAYLIESRSIGGLSGSPVFAIDLTSRPPELNLLGLIHGHYFDSESIIDEVTEDAKPTNKINAGIAIVTPASKILDIINGKQLLEMRKTLEDAELSKGSTKPPDKT